MKDQSSQNKNIIMIKDKITQNPIDSSKKHFGKPNPWSGYIKQSFDFDLFHPSRIDDLDLRLKKQKKVVFVQKCRSQLKLDQLKQWNEIFRDDEFPPNDDSLYGPYEYDSDWEDIVWKPLTELYPNGIIFPKENVSPRDIRQGMLGDCYFLAALAALAQSPYRIRELFLLETINEHKYFSVKVLFRGKWLKVDLDQMIPCIWKKDSEQYEPAFSSSVDGGLWVILLEKAWAKIYKSYKKIEAGFTIEVLHDLTGAPCFQIDLHSEESDSEQIWKNLKRSSQKNHAMTCGSPGDTDSDINQQGIVQGHAYTFLGATEISINNELERIVRIRNPWGSFEFNGKWSDGDSVWDNVSEQQKDLVQYSNQDNDGIFFMSYQDFLKYFESIEIAEIDDNASYVYESYRDEEAKGVYFTIRILKEGQYSFQSDMTPSRSIKGQRQKQHYYPDSSIIIKSIDDQKEQAPVIVMEIEGFDQRLIKDKKWFKPGKYVAFVKIEWDQKCQNSFHTILACYSSYPCGIYISSFDDAKKFTGDPKTEWVGQHEKYIFKERLHQILKNPEGYKNSKINLQSSETKGQDLFSLLLQKKDLKLQSESEETSKPKQESTESEKQKDIGKDKKPQKNKVLKTKETTKITEIQTVYHNQLPSKGAYTTQKTTEDLSEKVKHQYIGRVNLQQKVVEKKKTTTQEGTILNGEQKGLQTTILEVQIKAKTTKDGKTIKKRKQRDYTDGVFIDQIAQEDK